MKSMLIQFTFYFLFSAQYPFSPPCYQKQVGEKPIGNY